ncbi:hypothetical protein Tco_0855677 [Tanacetum coccineum]
MASNNLFTNVTNVNRHREVRLFRWWKFQALAKETLVESRECLKFGNDDFIRRGHILNAMPDPLLDVYQNYPSAREFWKALEERFFTEDATSKKFIITDQEDYASTSGWIFTLGGGVVYWGVKKQSCLTDSTMAAKFMAFIYGNNLVKVHLSECGSGAASYELRYRPKASFNGSTQSGLNEREEGYA